MYLHTYVGMAQRSMRPPPEQKNVGSESRQGEKLSVFLYLNGLRLN
jgi:hypothetical protein